MKVHAALVLFSIVSLFSCNPVEKSQSLLKKSFQRGDTQKGLTHQQAQNRSSRISGVDYALQFDLSGSETVFSGKVTIQFNLKSTTEPLTVDFREGSIQKLKVNGTSVSDPKYNKLFLTLAPKHLNIGPNTIEVHFTHPYSRTGSGLYRFKDPEDGNVYLYTDFQPYDANLLFPCFDQPDLKASYTTQAKVPSDWVVISATRENSIKKDGDHQVWTFPKSARFSTYLYSLHAGHYRSWSSKAGGIPLRLFARQSLAQYVRPKDWFTPTQQGFQFFNEYFDYPYPFKKYDQVIVPDFNAGAMENVAAVTFSERFLQRGRPTEKNRESLASVILHEMAHMWFGNLVTMKWWDDLWLNESFATYMAALAQDKATRFKKSWHSFYSGMKQWAYWEDQLVTTHPITGEVESTDMAFARFDGITYGKGASVLKQLAFYIGPETFQKGVRHYFKTYAYQTTQLKDFIGSLARAHGSSLDQWSRLWLERTGPNTLLADWNCEKGKITQFTLKQTAPKEYPDLRPHRTQVGLLYQQQERVRVLHSATVTYQEASTPVSQLIGKKCPDMVYPNYQDYDFVLIQLDSKTLKYALSHLSRIEDPFLRNMFWQSLWDMVRDAKLSLFSFFDLFLENAKKEKDIKTLQQVGRMLTNAVDYIPQDGKLSRSYESQYQKKLERLSWNQLRQAPRASDFQDFWFHTYRKVTQSSEQLIRLLEGKVPLKGFVIDQDKRWSLIQRLSSLKHPDVEKWIESELKKDPSESGEKSALSARAAHPSIRSKKEFYQKVSQETSSLSLGRQKALMYSLFSDQQSHLKKVIEELFYKDLLRLSQSRPPEFLGAFTRALTPIRCGAEDSKKLQAFIQKHRKALPATVLKTLRVHHQENNRCIEIRKKALGQIQPRA